MEPLDSYARDIARQIIKDDPSLCDEHDFRKSQAVERMVAEYKIPRGMAAGAIRDVCWEIKYRRRKR